VSLAFQTVEPGATKSGSEVALLTSKKASEFVVNFVMWFTLFVGVTSIGINPHSGYGYAAVAYVLFLLAIKHLHIHGGIK
jgi:hypothetical protein